MKKRFLVFLLSLMVILSFSACSKSEEKNVSNDLPTEAVVENENSEVETSKPVEESELTYVFLDELYPDLKDNKVFYCLNENLFSYVTPDEYMGLMNFDGTVLNEPEEDFYCTYGSDDVIVAWSVNSRNVRVFDKDAKLLFTTEAPEGYSVYGYSDGQLGFIDENDEPYYLFYDIFSDETNPTVFEISEETIPDLLTCSLFCNGYYRVTSLGESTDDNGNKGAIGTIDNKHDSHMYYDKDGNYLYALNDNTVTADGWVGVCTADVDSEEIFSEGVYNVNTGEYKQISEDYSDFYTYFDNGNIFFSDGNYVLLYDENSETEEEESYFCRVYDFNKERYITDKYAYISIKGYLSGNKYSSAQRLDDKWTYIDIVDEKEIDSYYDDTSDFSNGYAVVIEDGKAYIINEKFEKVAELDGEYDYASLSFCYSSKIGRNIFTLEKRDEDGNLTLARILYVDLY